MIVKINNENVKLEKGLQLVLKDNSVGTLTGRDPWESTSEVIKFKIIIDGEETTKRITDVERVFDVAISNESIQEKINRFDSLKNKIKEISNSYNEIDNENTITDGESETPNQDSIDQYDYIEEDDDYTDDNDKTVEEELIADKEELDKFGDIKPRFSLIPQLALEEVAKVLTYGAEKYPDFNYSKPQKITTYIDACHRHINKFLRNEDIDEETKTNHLANAVANLMITLDGIINNKAIDDRNKAYENNN